MEFTRVHNTKNQLLTKSFILCWSLTLEQFKQDVKNLKTSSNSLNAFKHNIKQQYFNELKKKESK